MKSIFIAAAVLLLCSAAFAVETEVSAEIETTILAMTEVEDTHAIVSMLQAEAEAAKSSQGVERLVKMLNKVLARLRRAMKRSSKRHAKGRKVCKSQLKTFSARITRARQSIRVLKTRISIAKDTAAKAVNDAAAFAKSIASGTAKAAQLDARNKVLSEEKRTKSTRWANANAETRQLIKVLRAIASKLTANGLVEVGSELTNAAASTTGTSAAMLLSIAAKAKTGNDASDIQDMIQLLIQTLLGDIKGNVESEAQYTRSWRNMVGAVTNSANAGRGNVKSLIAQRDRAIANGDKAKRNLLAFNVQLKAKIAKVRATKRLSKATKNSCRAAKKAFVAKRGRSLKQIRVLKEVIKTLRNTKLTAAMVTKLASVKLNLPVWKKSAWSACSKKCGLGKQTRTVSCSGKKCRGNKPRSTKSCTRGVCASDCIVSRWTSFSRCSVSCGGGIKTRTRKILAFAAGGGKACPSTAGLKQTKVCKQKACPAKQKKIVRRQQKQKKVIKVREGKKKAGKGKRSIRIGGKSYRLPKNASRRVVRKFRQLVRAARALKKNIAAANKKIAAAGKKQRRAARTLAASADKAAFRAALARFFAANRRVARLRTRRARIFVRRFGNAQSIFRLSTAGRRARKFCKAQARGNRNAMTSCMQDMRLSGDRRAIKRAVAASVKAAKRNAVARKVARVNSLNAPARTCSAVGDPHFTNFDGDYFHLQVPSIYTLAKSDDGEFEVQVRQDGSTGPGSFSWVREVKIRYHGKVYTNNFNQDGIRVTGGNQAVVTVPGAFAGKMVGVCGTNTGKRGAHNFALPNGKAASLNYGVGNWADGGYGGSATPMSQWQQKWRPSASTDDCMFTAAQCASNVADLTAAKAKAIVTPFGRVAWGATGRVRRGGRRGGRKGVQRTQRKGRKGGKRTQRKGRKGGLRRVKRSFKKMSRKAAGAVKSARKALKVARQRLAQAQANGRPAAVIARRRAAVSKAQKVWRRVRKLNKRLGPAKRAVAKSIRRLAVANRAAKAATRRVVVLRARAAANPSKQNRAAVRVAVRAQARARAVVVRARATVARVNRSFMRIVRAIVRRVFRSFGRRRG